MNLSAVATPTVHYLPAAESTTNEESDARARCQHPKPAAAGAPRAATTGLRVPRLSQAARALITPDVPPPRRLSPAAVEAAGRLITELLAQDDDFWAIE